MHGKQLRKFGENLHYWTAQRISRPFYLKSLSQNSYLKNHCTFLRSKDSAVKESSCPVASKYSSVVSSLVSCFRYFPLTTAYTCVLPTQVIFAESSVKCRSIYDFGFHLPRTPILSFPKKTNNPNPSPIGNKFGLFLFGPSGENRTHGLLNPIQARYQNCATPGYRPPLPYRSVAT